MNLEELKTLVNVKLTLKDGEFEEVVQQARKDLTEIGIEGEAQEKAIVNKVFAMYRKQLLSNAEPYEGIIIGVGDVTDYGAKNTFNDVVEKWKSADDSMKKEMIEMNMVDKDGNPLWCESTTKSRFKYQDNDGNLKSEDQRKIDLDKERVKSLVGIFTKTSDDEKKYHKAFIRLYGDKSELKPEAFVKVKSNFTGRYDEDKEEFFLNSSKQTDFVKLSDEKLTTTEFENILTKYFKDEVVDMESDSVKEQLFAVADKRVAILKNALTIRCQVTPDTLKSNIVDIGSTNMGLDENGIITCWLNKDNDVPPEGIGGVTVIGSLSVGERISMNCMNVFLPFEVKKPKPITPTEGAAPWGN